MTSLPHTRSEAAEAASCLTVFEAPTAEHVRIHQHLNFTGGVSDEQCHRRGYASRNRTI